MARNDHQRGVDSIGKNAGAPSKSAAPAHAQTGHNSQPRHHKKMRLRHAEFPASTCLQSAEFDPESETLSVVFTDGAEFDYDCSMDEWKELRATKSEGGTGAEFNFTFKGTK
jgi:hypothetical protein